MAEMRASQDCVFCKIISGEIPSKKVWEDEFAVVILDINPANEGHCLVLPKKHYQVMPQIPRSELSHLIGIVKKTSHTLLKSFGLQGTSVFIANGVAAGQKAPHFMIHVIPRIQGDALLDIPKNHVKEEELEGVMNKLLQRLGGGKSTPSPPPEATSPPEEKEKTEDNDVDEIKDVLSGKEEDMDIDKISKLFG